MNRGFTLIELLVVISIIGFMSSVVLSGISKVKQKSQDSYRVSSLKAFQSGLEAYYLDNGHYPVAKGTNPFNFLYKQKDSKTGNCSINIDQTKLRFDNSVSTGFLKELYPDYINEGDWVDPTEPTKYRSVYNCRYVIPCDGIISGCKELPQYYLLHCHLDSNDNLQENDGGGSDVLYEVTGGTTQLCVTGTPG